MASNAGLTASQLSAISLTERVASVFSLLGCAFIIITFSSSKAFHKPINRLVFYASFGNLFSNVGTLMARDYTGDGNSGACQFQSFLIQMFLPADALWALAMAINVYLTFYYKYDANRLRKMEIWYVLLCYGLPFIPALVYIFVSSPAKGRMYGNATLWCWISSPWDVVRLATFYAPVWVVIIIIFFIYIRAGGEIYKKRKQLRNFGGSSREADQLVYDNFLCPFSVKTTEVHVTREDARKEQDRDSTRRASDDGLTRQQYSVTISSDARTGPNSFEAAAAKPGALTLGAPGTSQGAAASKTLKRRQEHAANNAAWAYSKCAFLFFTAILITWIPSSANRVYSVVNTGDISVPLLFMSAVVLPLQGFWNAAIYMVTSWRACEIFFEAIALRIRPDGRGSRGFAADDGAGLSLGHTHGGRRTRHQKRCSTDSFTELTTSTRLGSLKAEDAQQHARSNV